MAARAPFAAPPPERFSSAGPGERRRGLLVAVLVSAPARERGGVACPSLSVRRLHPLFEVVSLCSVVSFVRRRLSDTSATGLAEMLVFTTPLVTRGSQRVFVAHCPFVAVLVSCAEWRHWCFCFVAPQGWQRWVHCGIVIVSLCGATLAHSCGGAGPCFHRRLWVLPTLTDAVWNAWRGAANTSSGVHNYAKAMPRPEAWRGSDGSSQHNGWGTGGGLYEKKSRGCPTTTT